MSSSSNSRISSQAPLLPVPSGLLIVGETGSDTPTAIAAPNVHLSIVVPTYNEGENVEPLVKQLNGLLEQVTSRYEIIIVDDNSPDKTWQIAQSLMAQYPNLRVMHRQEERGLSTAVIRGWQAAKGDVLGVIDGDLQHPPETLVGLIQAIDQGADVAVASRHVEGGGVSNWSAARRFLSRGAQMLGLVILPNVVGRVSDPMSGYFMVRRSAIAGKVMNPLGYKILIEVLGRGDIQRVAEVGYVFQERLEGESKVTWKQYQDYILHLLKLRSRGRITRLRQRLPLLSNFPIARFLRFGSVGLSGVFVDMAVFYLLRVTLDLPIARSTMLSAEVAVINNFLWNDLWTFSDISSQQSGARQRFKRFLKFNLICLMGIILQAILVSSLHDWFRVNEFVAKLIAIAIVTLWNFWINIKLSWRVTQVK